MKAKYRALKGSSLLPPEKFDFLVGESLKISKEKLFLLADSLVFTEAQLNKIKLIEAEAISGTPPEYIFKKAYFCENEFCVDENVLIPRPETELLVREAKKRIENTEYRMQKSFSILDLGTGSGCIAISIAKHCHSQGKNIEFFASDISPVALKIAKKNAKRHKVKINSIKSDLFQNINKKFDLILANLPYGDMKDPDYKCVSDPKIATNGGKAGFELIEKAILDLAKYLNPNGQAIFEIGYDQAEKIKKVCKKVRLKCTIKKDLNNFPRIAIID